MNISTRRASAAMQASDEKLIERISRGDCIAFSEFYDRHAPATYGYLVRLLRAGADADDVLQETFWQIWRTARRFDPQRATAKAWLFAIARSRALDLLRLRGRNASRPVDGFLRQLLEPIEAVERLDEQEAVARALSQLPQDQRNVVVLAFFGGHTHVEIAELLEIPLGTAKTRIALGMRRLAKILGHDYLEQDP